MVKRVGDDESVSVDAGIKSDAVKFVYVPAGVLTLECNLIAV
jgi:hypothetical protein